MSVMLTDGSSLHLAHAPAAMQLDRCFTNAEEGELPVEATASQSKQNLALSGSQRIEALDIALDHGAFRPPRNIQRNSRGHSVKQCLVPHRLGEKVHSASLHRLNSHGDVAVASEADNRLGI